MEIYEEKAAAVRASLAQVWDRLLANPHCTGSVWTSTRDRRPRLCDDLIGTIGRSQVEKSLRTLSNQQPSESGHGGSSDGLETSLTTPKTPPGRRTEPHREVVKTIHFEEVFQNGSAATKHAIIRFPADIAWSHFKDKAIESATAHLAGGEHGRLSKEPAEVIEQLGVQVLDCNETLADKNNTALREKISPSHRPTRQSRRRHHGDSRRQRDQDFDGIIDPRPGDVYLAFWEKSKEWLAVLLLPLTELDNVGVRNNLRDLGLAEDMPGCYDYDNRTNSSVRELSLVPHFQSVRKFLRDRAAPPQAEVIVASSGVDRTDSFNGIAHPAELAPCTAQSRSTTSAPDGQTSLPGGMRELEQSPAPRQEIPRNDHSDTQCEINPPSHRRVRHATSTAERDSLAAEEGAGDRVDSTAIISPRVSPQVSALAQAALDTLRSPAPVRDSGSTPLTSDDHCEAEPSAPSRSTELRHSQPAHVAKAASETPRNQGAEPVACRIMDEQSRDQAQHSPTSRLQLVLQGPSSSYSSTLSEGTASNHAPLQPFPALPPIRPLNRPPPNACALPPILPSRGQDTTFHAMSTHRWSNPATVSQVANPNAASSPLLGTVPLPVDQDCLSTGQGRAAAHASASAPSRFNEVRPSNLGLEKATSLGAPMHPNLQILSESESLDLNHWAYKLPGPLVDYLKEYLRRRSLVPEFNGLRNSEGFYNCPLCDERKVKNYQRPGSFTNHLVKHWRSFQNNLEVRLSE
ncbi:hypothetical protein B0J15DRAFT_498599 [Fusarium solani]|uniref:Uncharacterized protein n=1 Tax=Fusarium solani TaxID=169388 RepID=A0A9P9GZV8_FUSSL|nr:uncharacterized protein B0J15DRAFT_498599 [Fusarium solani]KAH7248485.1 hypothetical protein B0J15DRAFT_498599 [Fusarium solani]